ncbi:hypothetical protein [Phenylobacterium sp.]|jgi:hypothetical protein|uniref:hypothetical protein n=1 Tax=Phenylobacterium sp. TaxID=1871053 RepID=UPI002F42E522
MRIAIASLFAVTALATVAQAQQPAPATTPPAPPAPPAATPAAPPATAAAPPSSTAAPPATPAAPAPDASAQPATPPAAPPAAEAPPTLPTTGDGAQIIQILEKVCVPLVRGGNFEQLMKSNGFRLNRRDSTWSIQLGTTSRDYNISMSAPGANKDVCRGEVHYALNQDKPIVEAINIWSFLHQPELVLQANYVEVDPDGIKRVRKSWEHLEPNSSIAVNFSTWTKPDDSSLNAKYSTGELFYQERKLP